MSGSNPDEDEIPVEPPVRVETVRSHRTVTWKAGPLSQFVAATEEIDAVPSATPVVVDDTSIAGRERSRAASFDVRETVQYLRVEPDTPWTLSWEQRTWPVVSVSGTPPPALCRRLHLRTTCCDGWSNDAFDRLTRMLSRR